MIHETGTLSDVEDDAEEGSEPAELLVCVKCRRGLGMPDDARRPGEHLFESLNGRALPSGLSVTPVECLQNCDHGCTVALRGPGRWTYVYGRLHETDDVETLLHGAARYLETRDGLIPWRQRPEPFKRNCIARVPPVTDLRPKEPPHG